MAFVARFITHLVHLRRIARAPRLGLRASRGKIVTLAGGLAASWSSASRTTRSTCTGTRSPTPLRLNARIRSTSARPRSPAVMMLSRSRRSRLPFGASRSAISP